MLEIRKRDNTLQLFNGEKIRKAIQSAFNATREKKGTPVRFPEEEDDIIDSIVSDIVVHYEIMIFNKIVSVSDKIPIEELQDLVEKLLMKYECMDEAKAYIIYRTKRAEIRKKEGIKLHIDENIETPFSSIGGLVYKRTYARHINDDKNMPLEEWKDTVIRVLKACRNDLHVGFTSEEESKLAEHLLMLRGCPAGRFLWQLGTKTVKSLGMASLQNCAGVVVDHYKHPIIWSFSMLMLGEGVGFNVSNEHISKIQPITHQKVNITEWKDYTNHGADYYVPDTREGWSQLIEKVYDAFFDPDAVKCFSYSTYLIRPAGTPIKGFGGTASGPASLVIAIEKTIKILSQNKGKQLASSDWVDLANIIAELVKSGNIRRSAQIMLGDAEDTKYMHLKRWDLGNIPSWRSCSNNTVLCDDIDQLPESFWESYVLDDNDNAKGEQYGLMNMKLCRSVGRIIDGGMYPDPGVVVINPCGEQPLDNWETCCLSDLFLPNIESKEQLFELGIMLYRIMKHSLALKCHEKRTERIVHKNMRMGLSVSGYMQVKEDKKQWLFDFYPHLRDFDIKYSALKGWNPSIKLTTVKPSGTLSLMPGITPGCHPAIFKTYIRNIRVAADSDYVKVCREHGYPVVYELKLDGTFNTDTCVISFPCKSHPDAIIAEDMSAIDQLNVVKELQTYWSDNAVSCTVYYRPEELNSIKLWLKENYNKHVKTVSFMLHTGHGWAQAPYESISEEQYVDMMKTCKPIHSFKLSNNNNFSNIQMDDLGDCLDGACAVR